MLQSRGATATARGVVTDTTTQGFVKDVIEESRRQPVLVDFWAPWCGPCKQLTPILEKAVKGADGKTKLVKMNIDEHPAVAGQMGIQSIPAVIAFVNGQPIDGFLGALPERQVTAFIERLIKDRVSGEDKDLLKEADDALAKGKAITAADIYAQILAEDATSIPALAGLVRAYVETGAIEQAKLTLALVPQSKQNNPAAAAARAALEAAQQNSKAESVEVVPVPQPTINRVDRSRNVTRKPLFVSHVAENSKVVLEIVEELERRGVPCWVAPRDIRLGRSFDDEIAAAIEDCEAMLLIFSSHCNESQYIRREIIVADDIGKLIIPFRIEDALPQRGLRIRLADLQWIDAISTREHAINAVIHALENNMFLRLKEEKSK